ncbi:MAG: hypothetical protein ACOCZ3_02945, partial [Bacillota bacterium]
GDLNIIGWRDVNENNIVDDGDYFGKSDPLTVAEGASYEVDLQMNYISETLESGEYSVEGMKNITE